MSCDKGDGVAPPDAPEEEAGDVDIPWEEGTCPACKQQFGTQDKDRTLEKNWRNCFFRSRSSAAVN